MTRYRRPQAKFTEEQHNWLFFNFGNYENAKALTRAFNAEFNTVLGDRQVRDYCRTKLGFKKTTPFKFTEEHNKWLTRYYKIYTPSSNLANEFNSVFETSISARSVADHCSKMGLYLAHFQWTKEQSDWVREHFDLTTNMRELTNLFNREFGTDISQAVMVVHTRNTLKLMRGNLHIFTEEEIEWIEDNYKKFKNKNDFTVEFNSKFNTELSAYSLKSKAYKLGVAEDRKLTFTEEQIKWLRENYVRTVSTAHPIREITEKFNTQFNTCVSRQCLTNFCIRYLQMYLGKGQAVGSEKVVGEYIMVKVTDDSDTGTGYGYRGCFRYKHFVEWEKYHGQPLPEDKTVIFLNGDYRDFSEENLYCVDRRVANAFKNFETHDIETGLAIVAYIALGNAVKDKKKELKEERV